MKVVTFAWGLLVLAVVFSCGGKVSEVDSGAAGKGGGGSGGASNKPLACPGANGDLTKLQEQPCKTIYEGCGAGTCGSYSCVCIDVGQGLRWYCGSPCLD